MTISRRRLRFRFRFGFGLAAMLAVLMLVPAAYGAKPVPKPATHTTAAADQYKPTLVTYVTLTAARIGKCKLAVTRLYAVRIRRSKGRARLILTKAELAAKSKCNQLGRVTTRPTPKAKPKAKTTKP